MAGDRYKKALEVKQNVTIYLKLYSVFKSMKNTVLARAYVEQGLTLFPGNFTLNKISAVLHIRRKRYDDALAAVDKALAIDKGEYSLLTYRGLCYFHKRQYKTALLSFRDSLESNPGAAENYYYIALIYDNSKQYVKALEFYRVFFKVNPEGKHFKHRDWVVRRIREIEKHLAAQNR